jgi:hypothetical protein
MGGTPGFFDECRPVNPGVAADAPEDADHETVSEDANQTSANTTRF